MYTHVTLGVKNLGASAEFYDAVLGEIGIQRRDHPDAQSPYFFSWTKPGQTNPRFYIVDPINEEPATAGNGTMISFEAPTAEAVDKAYATAIKMGGVCRGPAGPRPHYSDDYYGAYFLDLDGNKIHILKACELP